MSGAATTVGRTFPSIEAFYADDERRRRSPERDFGCWWYGWADRQPHRVSWVQTTGEVYAFRFHPESVEVLAVIPSETELTRRLEGWADACGSLDLLDWVRQRLDASRAITDRP